MSTKYLDDELSNLHRKKHRHVQVPRLHDALYIWMKAAEKKTTITGSILKTKARQLFPKLYPERNPDALKFSDGWLTSWKDQYGVKEYKTHGEAGSAPILETEGEMQEIRRVLSEYELRNIFNADETAFYWRMQPDRGLATEQMAGKKKDKARISVLVTANGDGSEREPLWVIGVPKDPRCFKGVDRNSFGCQYRFNKTAWMRTDIFVDYLKTLNKKMRDQKRNIALLLDNFSAHEAAVAQLGGNTGLSNVRVVWLPKNTTSHYQPNDQGIIRTWKAHVRNQLLAWQVQELDRHGFDAELPKITLLQAIRWAVSAWRFDVKDSTIFNCFRKSTVKVYEPSYWLRETNPIICSGLPESNPLPRAPDDDEETELDTILDDVCNSFSVLRRAATVTQLMGVNEFLNPPEENVEDSLQDLEVCFNVQKFLF
jgi:hypothetical protein